MGLARGRRARVRAGRGAVRVRRCVEYEDRGRQHFDPQPTTPGTTVAYLDIRNNATQPDQLVSVSTSVGGSVGFLAPDGMSSSGTMIMKLVQDIHVPPNSLLRMNPNSYRLRITGAGPMQGGKDVILTLKFAHAGMVNVVALVTNPASGGTAPPSSTDTSGQRQGCAGTAPPRGQQLRGDSSYEETAATRRRSGAGRQAVARLSAVLRRVHDEPGPGQGPDVQLALTHGGGRGTRRRLDAGRYAA